MKTLSIKNPWGILIAKGAKDVENRSWPTKYRGKILIHTCKDWDRRFEKGNIFTEAQMYALRNWVNINPINSAIIGSVEIVDCIQNSKSIWAEQGQWHWVLKNPKLFEKPILDVKGRLGLWVYEFKQIEKP